MELFVISNARSGDLLVADGSRPSAPAEWGEGRRNRWQRAGRRGPSVVRFRTLGGTTLLRGRLAERLSRPSRRGRAVLSRSRDRARSASGDRCRRRPAPLRTLTSPWLRVVPGDVLRGGGAPRVGSARSCASGRECPELVPAELVAGPERVTVDISGSPTAGTGLDAARGAGAQPFPCFRGWTRGDLHYRGRPVPTPYPSSCVPPAVTLQR